jgi:REP element-mobilizing transposase RayT
VWVPKNRRKTAYGGLLREIGKVLRKLYPMLGILKVKSTMILFERYS